jgi:hypothetical protein
VIAATSITFSPFLFEQTAGGFVAQVMEAEVDYVCPMRFACTFERLAHGFGLQYEYTSLSFPRQAF